MNQLGIILTNLVFICSCSTTLTGENIPQDQNRWWPEQKKPCQLVKTTHSNFGEEMLVHSIAGLAAQAVNEGLSDELVWIDDSWYNYDIWYERVKKRLGIEQVKTFTPMELVKRYFEQGIIKGYIVYSRDSGQDWRTREFSKIDQSANVATTLSGILKGVIVEQGIEEKVKELGLPMLADARGKTLEDCFKEHKDKLNRRLLLTQTPIRAQGRAYTIAHRAMAVWGHDESVTEILTWLEPPSPILGWFYGGEDNHVKLLSRLGHHLHPGRPANLAVFSAGVHDYPPNKVKAFEPSSIDWSKKHATSFLMSDGDNFGWLLRNFAQEQSYWANPKNGEFPMGWTFAVAQLAQIAPDIMDYFIETKPQNASLVDQNGGYWYPDLFAVDRPNRKELLARHARQIAHYMRQQGSSVFSFICMDISSDESKEAFEIFANEMDGLAGMIAKQYYPYNAGQGKTMWFENKNGIEIPVITPSYAIWNHAHWDGGGTPAQIAMWINKSAESAEQNTEKSFSLTSVHAWSHFEKGTPGDPNSQQIGANPDEYRRTPDSERGLTPVKWSVDEIDRGIEVVTPEELIWRIRMNHNPCQTKKAIK